MVCVEDVDKDFNLVDDQKNGTGAFENNELGRSL